MARLSVLVVTSCHWIPAAGPLYGVPVSGNRGPRSWCRGFGNASVPAALPAALPGRWPAGRDLVLWECRAWFARSPAWAGR